MMLEPEEDLPPLPAGIALLFIALSVGLFVLFYILMQVVTHT